MTFAEYQEEAVKTAIYPQEGNTIYPLLGLMDEAAEVGEKIYKQIQWDSTQHISFNDVLDQAISAGKSCGILKKKIRDTQNNWLQKQLVSLKPQLEKLNNEEFKKEVMDECSDVLWYLAAIAKDFGFTLDDMAQHNIAKLASRQARGKLGGSGNNR